MSDFTINIDSKLDLSQAKTKIDDFIKDYDGKIINLEIKLDPKSANSSNLGKQLQSQLNSSVKNVHFTGDTFYKEYFKQAKKDVAEAKRVAIDFEKSITESSTSGVNKSAIKAVNAKKADELRAQKEHLALQKRQQKEQEDFLRKQRDYISKMSTSLNNGKYDAKSSSMKSQLSVYSNQDTELLRTARQQVELYDKTIVNLKRHFDTNDTFKMNDEDVVKSFNNMSNAAEKFGNTMTQIRNTGSKDLGLGIAERSANSVKTYYTENSKALKKYGAELRDLEQRYRSISTVAEKANLDNKFKNLKASISAEGLTGRSWLDEIGRSFKQIGIFAGTYGIIQRVPEYLMKMSKSVLEVDTAMTELRKVSDATGNEITNYFSEATEVAKEYGRTISDVINSTADWSRLGYSLPDSKELARVTSLYQNVGDNMTQESASKSLISTLQGFQLDASEAESIIDKFNEVANNYAIDTAGIGEALQNSAASFNAAHTDLSKSIALITGTNEVVQSPSEVGNMWKTVSMRIRSTKQEVEKAGLETDGMVESTSQLRALVEGLTGFDIMADEAGTQFKDIYDIVVGIGEEWDKLNDKEQAGLLETLAGKRQGNALAAALNNIETIKDVYNTAEFDSAGSAMKEQEKYAESLQFKLESLKATAQEFANVTLDSSWLKTGVDAAQTLLNILTQIEKYAGIIPLIFSGTAVVKAVKNFDKSNDFVLYGCESIVA